MAAFRAGVGGTATASEAVGRAGQRECTLYDTQMPVSAQLCSATSSFEKIRASIAPSLAATSSALHCAVDNPQPSCCNACNTTTESGMPFCALPCYNPTISDLTQNVKCLLRDSRQQSHCAVFSNKKYHLFTFTINDGRIQWAFLDWSN